MKNKILWVIFNLSLGVFLLLGLMIRLLDERIKQEYLDIIQFIGVSCLVFVILSAVNFILLNIDWNKVTDYWKGNTS